MRIYKKLFPYLKPHLGLLALASSCMWASSLFKWVSLGMLVPLVDLVFSNRSVVLPEWVPSLLAGGADRFQALGSIAKLHLVVAAALLLSLLKNLTVFLQKVLMSDVALRFLRDIRQGLYRHYQKLSLDFFSGERTGELVSRITYDVSVLQNAITEGVTDIVYQGAQVLVFATTIFCIDWKLALGAILLLPTIGYPMVRIGKILRKLGLQVQQGMAEINSRLIETLQGIRIIKAFTAERKEAHRFALVNQVYYKANLRTVKRQEALGGVTELIGIAAALLMLEIGGHSVLKGQLSLGTFVLFLAALLSLYDPFKKLSRLYAINQLALTAAKRVLEILETQPSVTEKVGAQLLPDFQREIRFENVWFRYLPARQAGPSTGPAGERGEDRFVLREIDLAVRKGVIVAIVGHSGSGKTTLVNLLLRFYDPTRGGVTIDGVDLKDVTLDSLRSQIGLVTQDPFLFHDSIYANIAFGLPEACLEKVIWAAKAAHADDFIRQLPQGYDSPVGELGSRLSGGQKQRIAIARAILKDPPILILDEATSQLDSESESLVQEALDRLMEGRTVFLIAHRLSTIRNADRIIVLDQGRIAEIGSHEELIKGPSVYRRLYELQVAP